MATTAEQVEQLLNRMREAALLSLLALDRERPCTSVQEEFGQRYPRIAVDPALFALVGVQPENAVEADKTLIRESIVRRLLD